MASRQELNGVTQLTRTHIGYHSPTGCNNGWTTQCGNGPARTRHAQQHNTLDGERVKKRMKGSMMSQKQSVPSILFKCWQRVVKLICVVSRSMPGVPVCMCSLQPHHMSARSAGALLQIAAAMTCQPYSFPLPMLILPMLVLQEAHRSMCDEQGA